LTYFVIDNSPSITKLSEIEEQVNGKERAFRKNVAIYIVDN